MKTRALFFILLLYIAASFLTLPRNPLLNDDASAYALAAKNAAIHNQWLAQFITPGDISSFLDKPPLGIWMLAALPKLAGVSEFTIHIPNVFYFSLIILIMYFWIKRLADEDTALYSALVAATSMALVVYSRAPKLDIPLTSFVMLAHFSLFAFLKNEKPSFLYLFALFAAGGFLVKSGFGILLPGLTVIALLIFSPEARRKILTPHAIFAFILFLLIAGAVLGAQRSAFGEQWIPYLKSILIQGKYSAGYLGFGFNLSAVGFLLITIFPWTPLFFSGLRMRTSDFGLRTFCSLWFWSNFLFFLLFFRLADYRTFTVLVPPMAIIASTGLTHLFRKPATESRSDRDGFLSLLLWNLFFLFLIVTALVILIVKPYNADGINVSAAIIPIALFVISLAFFAFFCLKPSLPFYSLCFALFTLSYSVLFWNTKPLADAFNPDIKWPAIIKEYRTKGYKFYIYRPPDRSLIMSPDLQYVDFIAGPADQYFWEEDKIKKSLIGEKAIVLSDTKSWERLEIRGKIVARDVYSSLVFVDFLK